MFTSPLGCRSAPGLCYRYPFSWYL